jgi:hypothetical protein
MFGFAPATRTISAPSEAKITELSTLLERMSNLKDQIKGSEEKIYGDEELTSYEMSIIEANLAQLNGHLETLLSDTDTVQTHEIQSAKDAVKDRKKTLVEEIHHFTRRISQSKERLASEKAKPMPLPIVGTPQHVLQVVQKSIIAQNQNSNALRAFSTASSPAPILMITPPSCQAFGIAAPVISSLTTPLLAYYAFNDGNTDESCGMGNTNRLQGLFSLTTADFMPLYDFDFSGVVRGQDDLEGHLRGGRQYFRPCGWKRFALNVNRYSVEDFTVSELRWCYQHLSKSSASSLAGADKTEVQRKIQELAREAEESIEEWWLAANGNHLEWAVAYHGTSGAAVKGIAEKGLRAGGSEAEVDVANGAQFGYGVYCTPLLEEAEIYADPIEIEVVDEEGRPSTKEYQVIFQCRVRGPARDSHQEAQQQGGYFEVGLLSSAPSYAKDYWVVPDARNVRAYGILMREA